jgi:hypothetical protein
MIDHPVSYPADPTSRINMAGEAKNMEAEVEILEFRLGALEEILKPFTQDFTSPRPYVNFEYVKEEMAVLTQRSEELHNLCHDKAHYRITWSNQILERTIGLKTLFIGIKQAPSKSPVSQRLRPSRV